MTSQQVGPVPRQLEQIIIETGQGKELLEEYEVVVTKVIFLYSKGKAKKYNQTDTAKPETVTELLSQWGWNLIHSFSLTCSCCRQKYDIQNHHSRVTSQWAE